MDTTVPDWLQKEYSESIHKMSDETQRNSTIQIMIELSKLLSDREFDEIDRIYRIVDVSKLHIRALIAIARCVSSAKQFTPFYYYFIDRCAIEFTNRNRDAESLLVGIYHSAEYINHKANNIAAPEWLSVIIKLPIGYKHTIVCIKKTHGTQPPTCGY
jgi:hypothetical protein